MIRHPDVKETEDTGPMKNSDVPSVYAASD